MKSLFITIMLVAAISATGLAQSNIQKDYTEVELTVSDEIVRGGKIMLEINDVRLEADASQNVIFKFPVLFKGNSTFIVRYLGNSWEAQKDLTGIGLIYIDLYKGGISPLEAAEATFKSQKAEEKLDVLVNDKSVGTTECRKVVKPNMTHEVKWKVDDSPKCSTTIDLPPGTRHSYTCDPATGKVTRD
jgi:hypothetical protein